MGRRSVRSDERRDESVERVVEVSAEEEETRSGRWGIVTLGWMVARSRAAAVIAGCGGGRLRVMWQSAFSASAEDRHCASERRATMSSGPWIVGKGVDDMVRGARDRPMGAARRGNGGIRV